MNIFDEDELRKLREIALILEAVDEMSKQFYRRWFFVEMYTKFSRPLTPDDCRVCLN